MVSRQILTLPPCRIIAWLLLVLLPLTLTAQATDQEEISDPPIDIVEDPSAESATKEEFQFIEYIHPGFQSSKNKSIGLILVPAIEPDARTAVTPELLITDPAMPDPNTAIESEFVRLPGPFFRFIDAVDLTFGQRIFFLGDFTLACLILLFLLSRAIL